MVWHIRGKRILTDSEARAEDGPGISEWLGIAAACFVMSWWLFASYDEALGAATIVGVIVGLLAYFFEDYVVPWGIYFCVGVLGWKALHWGKEGIFAVAVALGLMIWFWGDMFFGATNYRGHTILRILLVLVVGVIWYFNLADPLATQLNGLLH